MMWGWFSPHRFTHQCIEALKTTTSKNTYPSINNKNALREWLNGVIKTLTFGGNYQQGLIVCVWQCQLCEWLWVGMRGEMIDWMTHLRGTGAALLSSLCPRSLAAAGSGCTLRLLLALSAFNGWRLHCHAAKNALPCQPAAPSLVQNIQVPTDEN